MANYTYTDHVGDGTTTTFPFSFVGAGVGYLKQEHVYVFVNGSEASFTFSGTNQVTITPAPANLASVRVRRIMPKGLPFADFSRGNVFSQDLLNNSFLQSLYIYHEFLDGFLDEFPWKLQGDVEVLGQLQAAGLLLSGDLDLGGNTISNLANAINPQDAVTLSQVTDIANLAQGANYVDEVQPLVPFLGMRWYKPSAATTYVYECTNDVCDWMEEPVQSAEGTLRDELGAANSTVPVGGVPAGDLVSMASNFKAGSYSNFFDGVSKSTEKQCLLRKVSVNRFEVFTPFLQSGRFLRWRFDNDESQYNGVPADTGQSYVRPFLQTTVTDVFFEVSEDKLASTATSNVTPVVSGSYLYVTGTGSYFEFTGIRASRLRFTYLKTTNAGKFKITINGSTSLINLLEKDASGDVVVDSYSTSAGGSSLFIAENLPDTDLTLRFEVIGQNPSSTGDRLYLSEQVNPSAIRVFNPYVGVGTPLESTVDTLKLGGSAVDYAISFRPDSNLAANTPFIGSVHGYENREDIELYVDNSEFNLDNLTDGQIVTARNAITLYQKTKIYHPDQLVSAAADVNITWSFNQDGAKQGFMWQWLYSPFVTNGYTQMWTVYGANQGGAGGDLLGWADRVAFRGFGSYPVVNGDSAEIGHHPSDEVLFYGTPTTGARNADAGKTACLVKIADLDKSFNGFTNSISRTDAVWVQDRATFRKMYAQSLRAAGTLDAGSRLSGMMSVSFYKIPRMYSIINEHDGA